MKKSFLVLVSLCLLTVSALSAEEKIEADVVIYGDSSAAVTAAVQVKKMGKNPVIVTPAKHLGGLSSSGLGWTDSGKKEVIGGLAREFYHRIWEYYQQDSAWTLVPKPDSEHPFRGMDNESETMWVFEPSVAEKMMDRFVGEYNIPVYRGEFIKRETGVAKEGAAIKSISMTSGKTFVGKIFIDATYAGDLIEFADVSYTVGRESNDQYGETLNGIQTGRAVYHQFEGVVDPYFEPGNPDSGFLPGLSLGAGGPDGSADRKVQAYCYRLCLTNIPENRVPFEKPEGYDEADYELLFRSIEAGQKVFCTFSMMPNGKTDTNNNMAVSTDFIGENYDFPDTFDLRRNEIYINHIRWQKGLFWTLANHPRVPESIRAEFSQWGLAKDEFTDNENWPYQIYLREGRRMVSDFVETERHLRRQAEISNSVGMGSYGMDSHHCQRYVAETEDGKLTVRNEGDVQVPTGGPYPISYDALVPKKTEAENLLVPVCVSCSHIAYGSIRMEPVFMILGQSAATAAVLSLEQGVLPADLPYDLLRSRLLEDGQVLETP